VNHLEEVSKFQITISKSQTIHKFQSPMAKMFVWNFEFSRLEIIWYLACLREAPPCGTKAGAWGLVLTP
jgi:hypothetical protein